MDPLPEPQGESLPPPPFSLSFRLEEERRTRRRSLSLSESRRRRLLEAACCWGESGGGRDEGGREWWPEDGCCCCLPEGWWRWRWWWCSAGEVGKGTATEDEVSRAAEGGLEVSQTGTAVAEEDGEGGAGNGDRGAAADWVLSLCAGIEAAEEREVAAVALLLGAVANGDVAAAAAAAEVGAGAAEDDDDAGLHLTVTSPLGSDKNHSERCLIRSVCFWWTCKGAKRGTVNGPFKRRGRGRYSISALVKLTSTLEKGAAKQSRGDTRSQGNEDAPRNELVIRTSQVTRHTCARNEKQLNFKKQLADSSSSLFSLSRQLKISPCGGWHAVLLCLLWWSHCKPSPSWGRTSSHNRKRCQVLPK